MEIRRISLCDVGLCVYLQLVLVERQLECGAGAADTADLQQLKDNLTELIALTEGGPLYKLYSVIIPNTHRCTTGAEETEAVVQCGEC